MNDSISYSDGQFLVHIGPEVLEDFRKHVQTDSSKPESCGVLVGSTSVDFKEIWLESITSPLPKDCRGRTFFFLKDKGHQRFVDCVFDKSGGTQRLIGTWHTHPEKTPTPSSDDCRGWNKLIRKNPDFSPLIFAIIGTCEISVFLKRGRKFVKLTLIDNHEKIPRCR